MFFVIFSFLFAFAFMAASYFLNSYSLMCMGRKSGLKVDWMPFIPVAKTIYRLHIVRQPWWKLFFLPGVGTFIMVLATVGLSFIAGGSASSYSPMFMYGDGLDMLLGGLGDMISYSSASMELVTIFFFLYAAAILVFSFELEYRTFKVFGFNPFFAIATFVVPVASQVMYFIISFSNLYDYVGLQGTKPSIYNEPDNRNKRPFEVDVVNKTTAYHEDPPTGTPNVSSYIRCTAGAYRGASFPIRDGEELVIGRDSALSQIVVTSAAKVSRRHCAIRYSAVDGRYIVTDYSSNGTFLEDGTRLNPMTPTPINKGTVLIIGDHENKFELS